MHNKTGFTVIEMLIAAVILVILAGIAAPPYVKHLKRGRDQERITSLHNIQKAIQAYYVDNGHYPVASGRSTTFNYRQPDCEFGVGNWDGDTGGIGNGIRFDNSTSDDGIVEALTNAGLQSNGLIDPLNGSHDRWNCRYIIPMTSKNETELPEPNNENCHLYKQCGNDNDPCITYNQSGGGCVAGDVNKSIKTPHPDTYKQIQKYYLHCTLETLYDKAINDGGSPAPGSGKPVGDLVYELFEPDRWLCVNDIAGGR